LNQGFLVFCSVFESEKKNPIYVISFLCRVRVIVISGFFFYLLGLVGVDS
jgi:hypothetical protein